MPAELTIDGKLIDAIAWITLKPQGMPQDQMPSTIPTEFISQAIYKGDVSGIEPGEAIDPNSGEKKSMLESLVRFEDLPGLEFGLPDLLNWFGVNVGHFARVEMVEEVVEYPNLEHFGRWVDASLEGLYPDGVECEESEEGGEGGSEGGSEGGVECLVSSESEEGGSEGGVEGLEPSNSEEAGSQNDVECSESSSSEEGGPETSSADESELAGLARISANDSPHSWVNSESSSSFMSDESVLLLDILPEDLEDEIPEQLPVAEIILDDNPIDISEEKIDGK